MTTHRRTAEQRLRVLVNGSFLETQFQSLACQSAVSHGHQQSARSGRCLNIGADVRDDRVAAPDQVRQVPCRVLSQLKLKGLTRVRVSQRVPFPPRYAVRPISEQQLADSITPRAGQVTAFDKYGVKSPDGGALKLASHAFRHWLNDLLDRGGLSDVEQAVYFGRRNPKDNRAYQHMSPAERVRKAREDLKNGNLLGPVAQVIARSPVDRQEIVLAARVQAVHVVPGGACFHQFSQSPCPNHMACTDGCGDFHWQKDDPIQLTELQYQKSVRDIAVDAVKREVDEESWGADNWLQHNVRKLKQVNKCIAQFEPPASDRGNG